MLHWGISKKNPCEWFGPDDRFLPLDSIRFKDGKACQTKFQKDPRSPGLRSLHINFWWKETIEPAVKSMSYVLFEQNKNAWFNNNRQDFHLRFEDPTAALTSSSPDSIHHQGKIGEALKDIIACET